MRPGLKKKYEMMGQIVTVNTRLKRDKNHKTGVVKWTRFECIHKKAGWVVGFGIVYDGKVDFDHVDPECGMPDGSYFYPIKTHHILRVVYWPTAKPIIVLPEDITVGGQPEPPGLWTPDARASLSQTMKYVYRDCHGFPRGKGGQFIKLPGGDK